MAAVGWIKISRNIQECDLWVDDEPFDRRSAWIDLLLMANHEDKKIIFNGRPMVVERGQRITSVRKLAERWRWSKHKVCDFLDLLEEEERIVTQRDTRKTLVTIVNYGIYQDAGTASGTPKGRQRDTEGTPKGQNKNDKNEKNEKKIYGEFANVLLSDAEVEKLKAEFPEWQQAIEFLSAYIEEKGYKSKSHYLAIRRWVIGAVQEKAKKKTQPKKPHQQMMTKDADLSDLERRLLAN